MRRHFLGETNLEVSHLGFGCVKLTTYSHRRDAVRMLEEAFARGITHFDVARAYGFGRAEGILAEFLQDKRKKVTVATKFGIQPPSGLAGNRWAIDFAKRILRPFPALLRRAKQRGSGLVQSSAFTPELALQSLETSLRELRTDYIDLLLLHEATFQEANSEALLDTLQSQITRGTVRAIGVASSFSKLRELFHQLPSAYQVWQFDENARLRNLQNVRDQSGKGLIIHSLFQPVLPLQAAIADNPALAERFSSEGNVDLRDPSAIGSLLLQYGLKNNPNGVVLFASSDIQRLSANVRQAESSPFDERQMSLFVQFVKDVLSSATDEATPRIAS